MTGDADNKDRNESRKIAIVLVSLVLVLAVVILLFVPSMSDFIQTQLSPGLDLKTAAVIAIILTVLIMIVFAIASGDGLLGELQFVIPGFFLFFVFFWLMTAWVF